MMLPDIELGLCDPLVSPDANGWLPIESEPVTAGPMRVLLYYPNYAEPDFAGCDYSIAVGLWDRTVHPDCFSGWFEQGTNHDCFESLKDEGDFPTHWQPLPKPPVQTTPPRNAS